MVLFRLAISNFKVRKVRLALTVAAIALSVSLVVAVTSGYRSMQEASLHFLNQYMGSADALLVPANSMQGLVPQELVKELAADPDVRQAVGRLESRREMQRASDQIKPSSNPGRVEAGGVPPDKITVDLQGVSLPDDTKTVSMELIQGRWFDSPAGNFAVIDQVAAEKLGVKVGDSVEVPGMSKLTLQIVGEVHKPTFFAQLAATLYVPIETLQHFTGQDHPPLVSRITIDLRVNSNYDAFKQRWTARLATSNPDVRLHMRRDNAGELEKNLRGVHILSYLGGAVSMLTAMFIIFSALSMGVTERQRTLAMLRAVGAVRTQIFRLVVLEGIFLAAVGIAVGIPLGMLWMKLLYHAFSEVFTAGAVFSPGGMVFAAGGSMATALFASLLPGWWASRVSPLEAMNPLVAPPTQGAPIRWALVGLILASLDPILFFGPVERVLQWMGFHDSESLASTVRFAGHFAVGLPGIMIGFFLLAPPLLVWIVERLFAPLLAVVLVVPISLLRQQLSSGIWRAAGTAAALMVGLATLIAMQVQGHTLIGGWRLPTRFPDIFIWSSDLISWNDQAKLKGMPGIAPGSLMPVVVTTPGGDSKLSLALQALSGQDVGVMFFGVNPDQALRMIELDFRDNDGVSLPRDQQIAAVARVAEEMKKGRHIIVTDEFRQSRHVKLGDTIQLQTTINGWQTYTICGIVWSPGADVIISMFDLGRLLEQPTSGSVFGSIEDARRDFGVAGARLFAADLQGGIDKEALLKNVQTVLGDRGLAAGDVRDIKYAIERGFYRLLALLSTVAVAALAVASLGVANTVMASVRSRRWQFGVLRGIGLLRGDLFRLILAEALMLGIVAVALGLAAGLEISVDARKLSGEILGYSPNMLIPWPIVVGGCLAVVIVAVAASLLPALGLARAEPLELLQAGRASI